MSCNLYPGEMVLFQMYHNVFNVQLEVKDKESPIAEFFASWVAYKIQEIYIYQLYIFSILEIKY